MQNGWFHHTIKWVQVNEIESFAIKDFCAKYLSGDNEKSFHIWLGIFLHEINDQSDQQELKF